MARNMSKGDIHAPPTSNVQNANGTLASKIFRLADAASITKNSQPNAQSTKELK